MTFSHDTKPEAATGSTFQVEFATDFICGFAPKIKCMVNNQFRINGIVDTGFPAFMAIPMKEIGKNDLHKSGQWITAK